jgi:hypothetical protein
MGAAYASNEVYGFNTATEAWTTLPSLPETMGGCGAVVLNGKLHVIGGAWFEGNSGFTRDLSSHYELDLADFGAGWIPRANMSIARNHFAVTKSPDGRYVCMAKTSTLCCAVAIVVTNPQTYPIPPPAHLALPH